jgi:hypothetical protein
MSKRVFMCRDHLNKLMWPKFFQNLSFAWLPRIIVGYFEGEEG